jgi:hypothetical protein
MFRTEVVKSKNFRKTLFFKIYNALSVFIMLFILAMVLNVWGEGSAIKTYIDNNYSNVVQPLILIAALFLFVTSIVTRNASKSPKRLGSIEIDDDEFRYLVDDELQETIKVADIKHIDFEYFSFSMRGNPMGCMNYLNLETNKGQKNYEIVIANSMVKSQLGELLTKINRKVPVKVSYAYFLKKMFKDKDFNFDPRS